MERHQASSSASSSRALANPSAKSGQELSHVMWGGVEASSGSSSQESKANAGRDSGILGLLVRAETSSSTCTSRSDDAGPTSGACAERSSSAKDDQIATERKALRDTYEAVSAEEAMSIVPYDEMGIPLSLGSQRHSAGQCVPCAFLRTPEGCSQGVLCNFCHIDHSSKTKKKKPTRLCAGQRVRYRKQLERLKEQITQDPDGVDIDSIELPPRFFEGNQSKGSNEDERKKIIEQLKEHKASLQALNASDRSEEDTKKDKLSL